MLREHKPPSIRRIRISDFGLPDPKRDRIATKIVSLGPWAMPYPSKKFRKNPFTSLRVIRRTDRQTDRQTNRQTDRTKNITSFFGGGNQVSCFWDSVYMKLTCICIPMLRVLYRSPTWFILYDILVYFNRQLVDEKFLVVRISSSASKTAWYRQTQAYVESHTRWRFEWFQSVH